MDILAFNTREKSNEGAIFWLPDPRDTMIDIDWTKAKKLVDTNGNKVGIKFVGKYSDKFESIKHERINEAIANGGKREDVTSQSLIAQKRETIADCAVGFVNLEVGDLQFSRETVITLLEREPWLVNPADDFIGNVSNFLG